MTPQTPLGGPLVAKFGEVSPLQNVHILEELPDEKAERGKKW